jgi:XTP/dITP diphosphohydrolase
MKIVFATKNPGKLIEMNELMVGLDVEVASAKDCGVKGSAVEDGKTFEDNALKKALFVLEQIQDWSLAEDAGLCAEALNGKPGVHSARWAGENAGNEQILDHLLEVMKDIPIEKRSGYFENALVLAAPDKRNWVFKGRVDGVVALKPRGKPRPKLPYDQIFIPDGYDKTFAEMTSQEKNNLSHRGQAFRQLRKFVEENLL